jgi:hypothetical protein
MILIYKRIVRFLKLGGLNHSHHYRTVKRWEQDPWFFFFGVQVLLLVLFFSFGLYYFYFLGSKYGYTLRVRWIPKKIKNYRDPYWRLVGWTM